MDYSKFDRIAEEEEEAYSKEQQAKERDVKLIKEEVEKARKLNGYGNEDQNGDDDSDDSDLESCPLFWTKPPSMRNNASKKALEMEQVLQNMIFEDKTPAKLAEDFKERGNLAFKANQHKEALTIYSEALQYAHQAWTEENDMSRMIATILSNRAAIQLKQKNFRTAIRDAEASLRACPNGVSSNKARFRGAKACLSLNRPDEAFKKFFIPEIVSPEQAHLKEHESDDEDTKRNKARLRSEIVELATLVKEAAAIKNKLIVTERERMRVALEEQREDSLWRQRFAKHGVKLGPLTMDLQPLTGGSEKMGGRGPNPQISSDDSDWTWPCLFMYPEHSQSDYIQAFSEANTFEEVLSTMFPPSADPAPWDPSLAYTVPELEVYFRERASVPFDLTRPFANQVKNVTEMEENDVTIRRWFRVPKNATLGVVLHHEHYVIPGLPVFVVVSKASTKHRSQFLKACEDNDGPVVDLKLSSVRS